MTDAHLKDTVDHLQKEVSRYRRIATDRQYMIDALVSMLGPKAFQVWQQWQERGVQRVHHDWGPEAYKLDGEGRAQVLLDFEAALANSTPIEDVDAHLEAVIIDTKGDKK